MHRERLERMEGALRTFANQDKSENSFFFNLSFWHSYSGRTCGYTGCAIGLAIDIGLFEKEGLTAYGKGRVIIEVPMLGVYGENAIFGFDAVMQLFDIDCITSAELFSIEKQSESVPTRGSKGALATADRIRAFLDQNTITSEVQSRVLEDA